MPHLKENGVNAVKCQCPCQVPPFPAWQPSSISDQNSCTSCEYCNNLQSHSYHEDMHPDRDIESERE
eukprot:12905992-Prorocentrum_lima.AAC.1